MDGHSLETQEWVPVYDAAKLKKFAPTTVWRMVQSGEVPSMMLPRPEWKRYGPDPVRHIHMPSLIDSTDAHYWNQYTQQYDSMRQPQTKLGSFIRKKRQQLRWRQCDVASGIGVKNNTVSGWEMGHHIPSIGKAWLLCELFDMSPAERVAVFEALAWADNLEENDE